MAKQNFSDAAGTLQKSLNGLLERLGGAQSGVSDLLAAVRSAERTLLDKEEEEKRIRIERERQERLREMYDSDKEHAVHIGGVDAVSDEETDALIAAQAAEEAGAEPVREAPAAVKANAEEPAAASEAPVQEAPAVEAAAAAPEAPAAEAQAPAPEKQAEQPASIQPEKPAAQPTDSAAQQAAPAAKAESPAAQPSAQKPEQQPRAPQQNTAQGGYTARPIQQQGQGGYQQRPPQGQGGYQQRPPQGQGGYQQRPPQGQGGYTARPPQGQGGYTARPQQGGYTARPQQGGYQQGGYQQRPQPGGYSPRPQGQGGYTARPQQGGYAPRPQGQGGYSARPQQGGFAPRAGAPASPAAGSGKERVSNYDPNKSAYTRTYDSDKKTKNKKAIQRETAPDARSWDEDSPTGSRRNKRGGKQMVLRRPEPVVIEKAVITTDTITVKDLSEKIGKPAAQIIKKLFMLGTMATINQEIDFDTCELIANDYGIELEKKLTKSFEEVLADSSDDTDAPEKLVGRPPVVTIMGHVDHGKTSLLDAIRNSTITEGEAGGITQHIGAYTVQCKGRTITFIDTPGHEAFTSMRARGAQVTDIVILVVAADDGIMPQTIEAINHAKAAGVPIVVAINKMDKPSADPERVKQQLTEYGLVSEEWGGETICVPVSAKTQLNLDQLLEMVLLQADVLELTANPDRLAKGTIIEAKLDKGRGPIATVLVQNGTLRKGDTIVAGTTYGRIRAMMDDRGRVIDTAGPSTPVEILGFNEVPDAGDTLNVAELDKLTRQVAEERRDKIKAAQLKNLAKVSLDELFTQMAEGELKDLNIIVKADVQGSVEAVKQALEKLSNDEVRVRCIHGGVGAITGSDIMFASASNAIVIGFNVRPDSSAKALAEKEKVDVRTYRIIYNAIEDVQNAMKGMFKPVFTEVELGRISVRNTFKVSGVGTIAGAYVQDGKVTRSAQVRVVRDGIVVHEGKIASLKRFKDDAREVAAGYECGIGIENFNDVQEGDIIEAFTVEEVKK